MKKKICRALGIFLALNCAIAATACSSNNINEKDLSSNKNSVELTDEERIHLSMVERSLVSVGNNQRYMDAVKKAQNGDEVTLAYLGGSITQGAGATNDKSCYAYKSYEAFKEKYSKKDSDNVKYINAGIAGTPSTLGIVRSQQDVISKNPDIAFVEFAVNDGTDITSKTMYESLVKRLLDSPSKPAVILIFTVMDNGYSAQEHMQQIGEHYGLGMISVGNAINPEIEAKRMEFLGDYAADPAHPNDTGHALISEFIGNYFENAAKIETKDFTMPEAPLFGDMYKDLNNISFDSDKISSMGSFEKGNVNCFTYKNGFVHKSDSGNKPLTFTADFNTLILSFRQNKQATLGSVEVWVDGELSGTIDCYNQNGWGNIETKVVFKNSETATHTVELKMKDEDKEKQFYLLDIAIS